MSKISIVTPVFNSAQTIPHFVDSVQAELADSDFELVLVDDGSTDKSWEAIILASTRLPRVVRGFRLSRNFGQHAATIAGCMSAKGDVIVTLDDDLQFPASGIKAMVARLAEQPGSVIYGKPISRRDNFSRRFVSKTYKSFFKYGLGIKHASKISSFRAFESKLLTGNTPKYGFGFSIDAILAWATDSFSELSVKHSASLRGMTRYKYSALWSHFLDMLASFSLRPLRIVSAVGLVSSFLGLGLFMFLIANYFLGSPPDGFTLVSSTVVLFSGMQMFTLGVVGEYIGRIHWSAQNKPLFVVREDTSQGFEISEMLEH